MVGLVLHRSGLLYDSQVIQIPFPLTELDS